MSLLQFLTEEQIEDYHNRKRKICKYCGENKLLSEFPIRKDNHGGYDHRCISCSRNHSKEVRKTIAPYPPCFCEICGVKPSEEDARAKGHRYLGLAKDHVRGTDEFRGWLCPLCNRCLGGLGDTVESIERVLEYVKNTKERIERRIHESSNLLRPPS